VGPRTGLVKVKLSQCLIKYQAMKMYWASVGVAPRILNPSIRWKWVVIFTPRPLYPQYPLDSGLGGPQSQSGRGGEEKKSHHCPYRELKPGPPNDSDKIFRAVSMIDNRTTKLQTMRNYVTVGGHFVTISTTFDSHVI
jgi:hypothetical protein